MAGITYRRTWTGLLLSAFVFPGLGQLYYRSWGRGLVLMGAGLACLVLLFSRLVQCGWSLVMTHEPPSSLSPADLPRIAQALLRTEGPFVAWVTLILFGVWLLGILDAWIGAPRVKGGRQQARGQTPH